MKGDLISPFRLLLLYISYMICNYNNSLKNITIGEYIHLKT